MSDSSSSQMTPTKDRGHHSLIRIQSANEVLPLVADDARQVASFQRQFRASRFHPRKIFSIRNIFLIILLGFLLAISFIVCS
jgi:hypothetical protein